MMIKLFALNVKVATLEIINLFSVNSKSTIIANNMMINKHAFNVMGDIF